MNRLYLFLLFIFICLIYFFISPHFYLVPSIDQGNFLYIASQMLHGAVPYKNVWDNKPPGIYVIDAVGLFVGHGSLWGVWMVELIMGSISTLICFSLLKEYMSSFISFLATIIFLLLLLFFLSFEGGNFTEEYIVFVQWVSLWIVFRSKHVSFLQIAAVGFLTGISFLIKQNYIGLPILLLFFLLYQSKSISKRLYGLGVASICFLLPILGICFYFFLQNSLGSFWDDAFVYNKIYSLVSLSQYGSALVKSVAFLFHYNGFFILAWIIWGISGGLFYSKKIRILEAHFYSLQC